MTKHLILGAKQGGRRLIGRPRHEYVIDRGTASGAGRSLVIEGEDRVEKGGERGERGWKGVG